MIQKPHRTPPAVLAAFLLAHPVLAAAQQVDASDSLDYTYPVVITPTRLKQSLADVPASVTIITGDTIRRFGITNIPDALRLVPGMAVSEATGNFYRVNYHGTDAARPRRLNVLVDGVSAYRPALSQVYWDLLPVAMEDIDRIEVTRGPDSASYGPNSMMAVINILTKHPKDVGRGLASVGAGSHGEADGTVRMATILGPTHLYATANRERNSGYDNITTKSAGRDSTEVKRLSLRAQTDLADGSSLEWGASYVDGLLQMGYISDAFATAVPDERHTDSAFNGKWTKTLSPNHEVQIRASHQAGQTVEHWRSCPYQALFLPEAREIFAANPRLAQTLVDALLSRDYDALQAIAPTIPPDLLALIQKALPQALRLGISTSCGNINTDLDEVRSQVEVQDTLVVSDSIRLVGGFGLRHQIANSPSYFEGRVSNMVRWAFGHAEYRPTSSLTFNVGGYAERNTLNATSFSPRAAVNFHLTDEQSVRAVYSKGTRSPDLSEKLAYWNADYTDLTPKLSFNGQTSGRLAPFFAGNPDLIEERDTLMELGYLLAWRRAGATLDLRVFNERLSKLISYYTTIDILEPTNNGHVHLRGAEAQLNWDLTQGFTGWLSFSRLLSTDASTPVEQTQYSAYSGGLGLSYAITPTWLASAAHYHASGDGHNESPYARTDLGLMHSFSIANRPADASLLLGYLHTASTSVFWSNVTTFRSSYNDKLSVRANMRLAF